MVLPHCARKGSCVGERDTKAAQRRQGFGHVVTVVGRLLSILQATGKGTALDMAALLKREALDVIGDSTYSPSCTHSFMVSLRAGSWIACKSWR